MSKVELRKYLSRDEAILADGGVITALYDKGFYINRSFEELCLTDPQAVRDVTQGYFNAGARLLKTNTFNALIPKLTKYGLQKQHREILFNATEIVQSVAGDEAYTLAAIGPLGVVVEPLGPTSFEEAEDLFGENVRIFEEAGVDGFILLGFHDFGELRSALRAVKKWSQKPVIANIGIQENMKTSFGNNLTEFAELGRKMEVDILGFSGEVGPSGILTAVEKLRALTSIPIAAFPNAGLPRYVNDEYIYMCSPDYMGKYAKRLVQAGANIVGGHSGVHEDHVRAIGNSLRMVQKSQAISISQVIPVSIQGMGDEPKTPVAIEKRSRLGAKLARGEQVVTVEIVPPRGVDCTKFFKSCRKLQDGGIDFVNIPDGARAVSRMSSVQLAAYIANHFELEPIPHYTARDRNLLGLQADLLGAYVNGVRNVLVVTGDPPKLGNCPGASGVYDVDAIGLTHVVHRMNQGLDLGGSSFGEPSEFLVGVALNPTAPNRELEIKRFKYKVEAGANYAITQPIYSLEAYQRFLDELGDPKIPIIMGIWPLVSLRNAEFLKNEVPGVDVPDWVIAEMQRAGNDKDEALKRGLDIAMKTMGEANGQVAGFQVSAPFNRVEVAIQVIDSIKSKEASA